MRGKETWPGAGIYLDFTKLDEDSLDLYDQRAGEKYQVIKNRLEELPDTTSRIKWLRRCLAEIRDAAGINEFTFGNSSLEARNFFMRCVGGLDKQEEIAAIETEPISAPEAESNETLERATRQLDFDALLRAVEGGDLLVKDAVSAWMNIKDKSLSRHEQGERMYQSLMV